MATLGVAGVFIAILFAGALLFSFRFIMKSDEAIAHAQKVQEEELERVRKFGFPIEAWPEAPVTLVDDPTQPHVQIVVPGGMPKFCQSLSRLSSVIIKCPKCRMEFLRSRTLPISFNPQEMDLAKKGQLSYLDMLKTAIQRSGGYSSSFNCIHCGHTTVRSREPSAICTKYNRRVVGEELLGCLLDQCTNRMTVRVDTSKGLFEESGKAHALVQKSMKRTGSRRWPMLAALIPEFSSATCPKCHSDKLDLGKVNRDFVTYKCESCGYIWIEPRKKRPKKKPQS